MSRMINRAQTTNHNFHRYKIDCQTMKIHSLINQTLKNNLIRQNLIWEFIFHQMSKIDLLISKKNNINFILVHLKNKDKFMQNFHL